MDFLVLSNTLISPVSSPCEARDRRSQIDRSVNKVTSTFAITNKCARDDSVFVIAMER